MTDNTKAIPEDEAKTEVPEGFTESKGIPLWMPDKVGDQLRGKVLKVDAEAIYGLCVTVDVGEDQKFRTPSHKMLQSRLEPVQVGNEVIINFKGEEPSGKPGSDPTKIYDVFIKD